MAVVYWLHLEDETDIFSQGYVGVTEKMAARLRSHKHHFKSIWHKVIIETIVDASKDYCFLIESKLRPTSKIGWNKGSGGKFRKMIGEQNPNYEKFGEDAPNFIGWYITPFGKFARAEDAAKKIGVDSTTIQRRCRGRFVGKRYLPPHHGYAFEQKV